MATIFDSDNEWGIPTLQQETWVPRWLQPYGERVRTPEMPDGGALHFFLDDFRFEIVWNRPIDTLAAPQKMGYALTPMFSCYHDWPKAGRIWNTYRNRWMGAYWQMNGIHVIPTVTLAMGDVSDFDFVFAGIPRGSTVAASAVGVNDGQSMDYFRRGYREMVERLQPNHVVFYGYKIPEELQELAPISCYPTRWDNIRQIKKQLRLAEANDDPHKKNW